MLGEGVRRAAARAMPSIIHARIGGGGVSASSCRPVVTSSLSRAIRMPCDELSGAKTRGSDKRRAMAAISIAGVGAAWCALGVGSIVAVAVTAT